MMRPKPSDAVIEAFRFLLEQRDFLLANASDDARESYVTFRSERVIVSVMIDGAPPDVNVAVVDAATGRAIGLDTIVRATCPEAQVQLHIRGAPLSDQLETTAALLRRCAEDLLAGETTRIPSLRRMEAVIVRERNKATFGTSTGESPRFATRPSLAALFAGATNPGLREVRAYQAHWDYEYTLDDIAAFLAIPRADVQAMLDRWDQL